MNTKNLQLRSKFSHINNTLAISALFILFFIMPFRVKGQCPSCTVNSIDLSTGVNQATGVGLPTNSTDPYWTLTGAPTYFGVNYTVPSCAKVWDYTYMVAPLPITCRPISCVPSGALADANLQLGTCSTNFGDPYVFSRTFDICNSTNSPIYGTLIIDFAADDYVSEINITGPTGTFVLYTPLPSLCTGNINTATFLSPIPISLISGHYTLNFNMYNVYIKANGGNDPTKMHLQAYIKLTTPTGTSIIIDKDHSGLSSACNAPYLHPIIPIKVAQPACITTGGSVFTISPVDPTKNFDPILNYTINGSPLTVSPTGTFTLNNTGTYTITCSDALLCSISTTFNANVGPPPISISGNQTVCSGTPTTLTASGAGVGGTYQWNTGAATQSINVMPTIATTYTVTGTNSSGCSATSVVTVNVKPVPSITVNAPPTSICGGSTFTITTTSSGANSYQWVGPAGLVSNASTYSNTASSTTCISGIYTVTATNSTTGCTASTTVPLNFVYLNAPTYTINCASNPPTATITNPTGAAYTYSVNGGTFQSSPIIPLSNTGTYPITVSSGGCSASTNITVTPQCVCHTDNVNTQYVSGNYNTSSTTISGLNYANPIVYDGTLNVNATFSIPSGSLIYFTPNSKIQFVSSGVSLNITNSTLQSCGLAMWDGIYTGATLSGQGININGSHLLESINGINILNNAVLHASNNYFSNNGNQSILFDKMTAPTYTGTIYNNTFNSYGTQLLPPIGGSTSISGIKINNVRNLTIGSYTTPAYANTFDHINNGIFYNGTISGGFQNTINIYNNNFNNIQPRVYMPLTLQLVSKYFMYGFGGYSINGGAIYGTCLPNISTNINVQNAQYNPGICKFLNCAKGIILNNVGTLQSYLNMENVLMGSMNNNLILQPNSYTINNCLYNNVFNGIEVISGTNYNNNIKIVNNYIKTSINGIPLNQFPVGIHIQNFSNSPMNTGFSNFIDFDTINIRSVSGIGIYGINWNDRLSASDNYIEFTTSNTTAAPPPFTYQLSGIYLSNCIASRLKHNYIGGPDVTTNNAVFNARLTNGLFLDRSLKLDVECNQPNNTWYGFKVQGNCQTATNLIAGNTFNNHKEGINLTRVLLQDGTLGQIATNNWDNVNYWNGLYVTKLNLVDNQYHKTKIYQHSISSANADPAYTDLSVINNYESFPDASYTGSKRYDIYSISNYQGSYKDPCMATVPTIKLFRTTNIITDINVALQIASDAFVYANYDSVEAFKDQLLLYETLDVDTPMRNADPILSNFYNTYTGSDISDVNSANQALLLLSDSTLTMDSTYRATSLLAMQTANDNINNSNNFMINERLINDVFIKLNMYGMDSITVADSTFIDSLAQQCPGMAGDAVFKARILYSIWNAATMWDDQATCAAAGMYKGGENWVQKERDEENNTQLILGKTNAESIFNIYPNPSSGILNIDYSIIGSNDATLKIYNAMGQLMYQTDLPENRERKQINLFNLPNGIYSYQIMLDGRTIKSSKLTLVK